MAPVTTEADIQKALKLSRTIISVKPGSLHTTEMETRSIARALILCREPVLPIPARLQPAWATCPNCGDGLVISDRREFCPGCGRPIEWEETHAQETTQIET